MKGATERCQLAVLLVALVVSQTATIAQKNLPAPTWRTAGMLATPRAYATAVPLRSGEVLVFGGLDATDPHVVNETTEVFDPPTSTTRVLEQRITGRTNLSATMTNDGRVVVAGGSEWSGKEWEVTDRVEIFDPTTYTWREARPLIRARTGQGATALPDGRVLVTGGYDGPRLIKWTEIYDPRTDIWTEVAPLPEVRGDFSLVTLNDGRVLLAGGMAGAHSLPALDSLYYYPAEDRWERGPALHGERVLHATVQLKNGDVMLIGGQRSGSGTAERYDARRGVFVFAGVLSEPRMVAGAAVLPDGRVLLTGGLPVVPGDRTFNPSPRTELWDPVTATWSVAAIDDSPRVLGRLFATKAGVWQLTGAGEGDRATASIERFTHKN